MAPTLIVSAIAVFCLGAPSWARADEPSPANAEPSQDQEDKAAARLAFNSAIDAIAKKNYHEGLNQFLRAQELAPHPVVLFNIARTYEQLENLERALTHYLIHLSSADDSPERRALSEQAVERLKQARQLTGDFAGRLRLTTRPAEARVRIDGTSLGFLSHDLRLPVGEHQIEASAAGFESEVRTIEVLQGQTLLIEFSLRPSTEEGVPVALVPALPVQSVEDANQADPSPPKDDEPLDNRDVPPEHRPPAPPPEPDRATRRAHRRRTIGFSLTGVGAAAMASGLGLLIWNESRYREWKADQEELSGLPDDTMDLDGMKESNNELGASIAAVDKAIWAVSLSGVALLATGITLVVYQPKNSTLAWTGRGVVWTSQF